MPREMERPLRPPPRVVGDESVIDVHCVVLVCLEVEGKQASSGHGVGLSLVGANK